MHISKICCTFAASKVKRKEITMEAVLEKQVGTISMEQWDNLHTIEELDSSLKAIIHKHFHA